jgi:PAS domain S-box-containing protein
MTDVMVPLSRLPMVYFRSGFRRIWVWALLLNLLVAGLAALSLWEGLDQAQQRAVVASQNLSALLTQGIGAEIDQVDLALAAMADEAQRELAADDIDPDIYNGVLERQQKRLPFLDGLRATDASGITRYGPGLSGKPKMNLSDRDYFIALQQPDADGLIISHPLQSRRTQEWIIILARRILGPTGQFAGIVYAALPVRHFNETLASLALGENGTAILRSSEDFALVGRYPVLDAYGQTKMSQEFLNNVHAAPALGTYLAHGAADGIERIFTYRRLDHHPLMILVGIATEDYVGEWRQEAHKTGWLAALFFLTTLAGAYSIAKAGRERLQAYDQLHLLLNSAGVGIFGIDSAGFCTFCNPAALAMFGLESESQLVGQPLHAKVHHSHADGSAFPEADCPVSRSLASGQNFHGADLYWRPDGTSFPIEFWVTPQARGDKVVGAVVTFADISNRQKAEASLAEKTEELARSNAELEQFAYVASHDLREPLRMVASYIGLLERRLLKDLDEECRDFLATAKDGAKRMDRLIIDLLEYSRIGRDRPPMATLDLSRLIAEATANLSVPIEESQARLEITEPLPQVLGDHGELVRLFQNLIGNAVKYRMPERAPVVRLAVKPSADGRWEITIRDNGIGIPEDQRERIFGVFQRLHARNAYDGTGIGLAICRKIAGHHGGQLWVSDAEDGGSIFHVTLAKADGAKAE